MFVIANTLIQKSRTVIHDVHSCEFYISRCLVPYRRQIQTYIKYCTIQYKICEIVVLFLSYIKQNYRNRSLIFVKDLQQPKNSGSRN